MFSTGLARSDDSCTLQSTGTFDAFCDNGSMKGCVYMSCLGEMNYPNDDIEYMVSTTIHWAYADECIQILVLVGRWIKYLQCVLKSDCTELTEILF